MLMNERVYCEGVVNVETPLQTIFGVSNEWTPEGHEEGVNAFFDRFLFRKDVQEIATDEGIEKLLWADQLNPNLRTTITPDELAEASRLSLEIPWTDEAKESLWEIIKKAEKEWIHAGDRRNRNAPSAAQAFAFVCGGTGANVNYGLMLAKHGIHICVEKPLSHSRLGLDELEAAIKGNKLTFLVGYNFRFSKTLACLRRLVVRGEIEESAAKGGRGRRSGGAGAAGGNGGPRS